MSLQEPERLRKTNKFLEYEDFNFVSYNFLPLTRGEKSTYRAYLFLLCFDDGLTFNGKNEIISIKKNDLFVITPMDYGCFVNTTKSTIKTLYLVVSEELFCESMNYSGVSYVFNNFTKANTPFVIHMTAYQSQTFRTEFSNSSQYRLNDTLQSVNVKYFLQFLTAKILLPHIYCKQTSKTVSSTDIPLWLAITLERISFDVEFFSKGVEHMANIANCSPTHLERSMKKYLNITPLDFLTNLRLKYVARTLLISDQTVNSIFFEAGYTNISWGRKLFKQRYGVTPAKYRKDNKIKDMNPNDSVVF